MKLDYLFEEVSLDELIIKINQYFGMGMRIIHLKRSVFEQYEVRPQKRMFIPEICRYRIVAQHGKYFFGKT